MGSNQFQREYIEYLQERNTELVGKLNDLKENYENRILSKDLSKHYLTSTLEDVLNICTQIPQEIDVFFEKMNAAMGALKGILLRKSEMVQLVEKISKVLHSSDNYHTDLIAMDDSSLLKEPLSEGKNKKTGTVKVAPMINGHIISTEPRIYLSRVSDGFIPKVKNETHQLSPIIEASPDITSDLSIIGRKSFREIRIPVERLNLNKLSYNYLNEESPKSRFKGPKTWKKSLASAKQQTEHQRNQGLPENKEHFKKITVGEMEDVDPLEGPSWLHDENEVIPSPDNFINYRRRKHRFAKVFDNDEEQISSREGKLLKLSPVNEDSNVDNQNGGCDDIGSSEGSDSDGENEIDNKENLSELKNVVNESSEDLFCDSNDFEGSLPVKPSSENKLTVEGEPVKDTSMDNNQTIKSKNNVSFELQATRTSERNKYKFITNQFDPANEKENKKRGNKKSRKQYSECCSGSVFDKTNSGLSVLKSPCKSICNKQKAEIPADHDLSLEKQRNISINDALKREVCVELENCMNENIIVKGRTTSQKGEKLSDTNLEEVKSKSPAILLENEGRKRRKAAPTFKLEEPKLNCKLRRN